MPFYVSDYLSDTTHLTTEEHGAYLLLIMAYWKRGSALPDDDEYLRRICKLTNKKYTTVKLSVFKLFELKDGFWTHKRLEKEILKSCKRSTDAQRARNARTTVVQRGNNGRSTSHSKSKSTSNSTEYSSYLTTFGKKALSARQEQVLASEPPGELFGEPNPVPDPAHPSDNAVAAPQQEMTEKTVLYRRAMEVMGKGSGGIITKALKLNRNDAGAVLAMVEVAAKAADPKAYMGAILKNGNNRNNRAEIERKQIAEFVWTETDRPLQDENGFYILSKVDGIRKLRLPHQRTLDQKYELDQRKLDRHETIDF
jgi:uncharacterized protein YdaU (DUF1376 family)